MALNITKTLVNIIAKQTEKELAANIWTDSIYKELPKLQSNNVGIVGEQLIQSICINQSIESNIDGSKTKKIGGGKEGDGNIMTKSVEIKTAHLGSNKKTFQHELAENPWYSDYIIFIDIAPLCIYITIFKNFLESQYKQKIKCKPYFPTKKITQRKGNGNFKIDTSIAINDNCVKNGYSIKIIDSTTFVEVGDFIKKIIL
jgi:hypothetical protein